MSCAVAITPKPAAVAAAAATETAAISQQPYLLKVANLWTFTCV